MTEQTYLPIQLFITNLLRTIPLWLSMLDYPARALLYKVAKLQAGIKPTTLCSVIDKENSIEFLLDLLHYIYNYYCGYAPCLPQSSCYSSANFLVICHNCDLWPHVTWPFCDHCHTFVTLWLLYDIFLCSTLVII